MPGRNSSSDKQLRDAGLSLTCYFIDGVKAPLSTSPGANNAPSGMGTTRGEGQPWGCMLPEEEIRGSGDSAVRGHGGVAQMNTPQAQPRCFYDIVVERSDQSRSTLTALSGREEPIRPRSADPCPRAVTSWSRRSGLAGTYPLRRMMGAAGT